MSHCHNCGEKNCHKYPRCVKKCLCEVEIPSFKCIRTDEDFSCIGIKKGDTLSQTILAISQNFCNFIEGQQGPAGVGIQSTSYNPSTGELTFTYTNGYTYTTGDIRGEAGPQGPPGPEQLFIENTLIVSKNGNDLTGTRNDWTKPFLTVLAASSQAQPGDLVIVFPGNYNEDDFIFTDINYEFMSGVTMTSTTNCINDSSGAKNIHITGEGDFVSTSGRGVFLVNPASNIYMRCRNLSGFFDGIAIGNANKVDIEGRKINVTQQYLATIRGNSTGRIHFDEWDASLAGFGSASIYFVNHSLDLTERTFEISGKILYSNSSVLGAFAVSNSPTLYVKSNLDIEHTSGSPGTINLSAINISSGSIQYTGKAESVDNPGLILTNTLLSPSKISLKNSEIVGKDGSMRILSSGSVYVRSDNTIFRKSDDSGNPTIKIDTIGDNTQVILRNSDVYNMGISAGADGIYTDDGLSILRLSDVKVVLAAAGGFLMDSAVIRNVLIESIVFSSNALSANVTNGVTGSVLVVDPLIQDNDFNF